MNYFVVTEKNHKDDELLEAFKLLRFKDKTSLEEKVKKDITNFINFNRINFNNFVSVHTSVFDTSFEVCVDINGKIDCLEYEDIDEALSCIQIKQLTELDFNTIKDMLGADFGCKVLLNLI